MALHCETSIITCRGEISGSGRRGVEEKNFRVAGGVEVVVDLIRAVGFGYEDVHELVGVFGDADDQAGLERNVGDGFVGAGGGAGGAEALDLEIAGGGVFGRGFLF